MTTRTALLTLHIISAAGWLGADLAVHALTPRMRREPGDVGAAWARMQVWMHERYYAVVVVALLATGVWLVLDGPWDWSDDFVWVGIGAIVVGASIGGGGLGRIAKAEVAAHEAGDVAGVARARRGFTRLSILGTAVPVVAILAMVDKWSL